MRLVFDDPDLLQRYEADVPGPASPEDVGRAAYALCARAFREDGRGAALSTQGLIDVAMMWTTLDDVPLNGDQYPRGPEGEG